MWFWLAALAPAADVSPPTEQVLVQHTLVEICGAVPEPSQLGVPHAIDSSMVPVAVQALLDLDGVQVIASPSILSLSGRDASVHTEARGVSTLDIEVLAWSHDDHVEVKFEVDGRYPDWSATRKGHLSLSSGRYATMVLAHNTCETGEPSIVLLMLRADAVPASADLTEIGSRTASETARYESIISKTDSKRTQRAVRRALVEVADLGFALPQ